MSKLQIPKNRDIRNADALLQEGMALAKCRKCQCMKDALDNISKSLRSARMSDFSDLRNRTELWLKEMQPIEYT